MEEHGPLIGMDSFATLAKGFAFLAVKEMDSKERNGDANNTGYNGRAWAPY